MPLSDLIMQQAELVQNALAVIHDPLRVLELCDGLYICPKKDDDKRLGPLVPYRGKDAQGRHLVGDIYANWAAVEEWPKIAKSLAFQCLVKHGAHLDGRVSAYCGAPEGGKHLADKLALQTPARYCYTEKKGDELVWGRHAVSSRDHAAIVEDVANNFTTTEQMIQLIQAAGATPVAIVCYLNRSTTIDTVYMARSGLTLPICALVRQPFPEYEQDDPEVADDIAAGNIVADVKDTATWNRLQAIMKAART